MHPKHLMIAVNWYGPYRQLAEAHSAAKADYDHGLYVAIGRNEGSTIPTLQYIGIGDPLHRRLVPQHKSLSRIAGDLTLWLGEIATAEPSGQRMKVTKTTLDYAEWLHIRFLNFDLNEKKTKKPPPRSVTVLNRWFHTDYERAYKKRPHPDWADLIDFPGFDLPARSVWFGSRQKSFTAPDYTQPHLD